MDNNKISPFQFFILMVLMQLGSAVVVGIGMDAKQDAWIAVLLGMVGGLCLFSIYGYLGKEHPGKHLFDVIESIVGKMAGKVIGILYISYFIYIAARVLRDFGELLITTVLEDTPLIVILMMMMMIIIYAVVMGLEVLARTGEIFAPYMFLGIFLFIIFVFVGNLPDTRNLQPVLEQGWKPVLATTFPNVVSFPFGETVVFWSFMSYIKNKNNILPIGLLSILISGLFLSGITALNISVLGVYITQSSLFPFFETIERVNVGDVFQRLDPIAIAILIVGGFFKISIHVIASVIGVRFLHKKLNWKYLPLTIAAIVVFLSIVIADNFVEHLRIGFELVKYTHVPPQFFFPLLLLIIYLIKKKIKKRKNNA